MNCKSARDLFSSRVDGRLSFSEERRLIQHLEVCNRCASDLAKLERNVRFVRELPEIPPTEGFLQDVMLAVRRVQAEGARPPEPGWVERLRSAFPTGWLATPRFAAAALVLGLAIGVGGAMLALRAPQSVMVAEEVPTEAGAPAALPSAQPGTASATGQFEDLVDEMLRRVEAEEQSEDADTDAPPADLDWGSAYSQDALGRQVGSTNQDRRARDPNSRVTIVF